VSGSASRRGTDERRSDSAAEMVGPDDEPVDVERSVDKAPRHRADDFAVVDRCEECLAAGLKFFERFLKQRNRT